MAIRIHVISIFAAFITSFFIFLRKKGTTQHKIYGWIFVICMGTAALSSFWIPEFARLSFIHILSILTLYWLAAGVRSIRLRKVQKNCLHLHSQHMGSAYIAIWIAGVGVFVRHYVFPFRSDYGGIASLITALIIIPIMINLTKSYKARI